MVAKTLIAAIARAQRQQETQAVKKNDPEEFKRRFAEVYGRGGTRAVNPTDSNPAETTTPTDDPTIFEDDDQPPERLPDNPTIPDDAQDAQIPPATPPEEENQPTIPPTGADAPQGGKSRHLARRRVASAVKGGRKSKKGVQT